MTIFNDAPFYNQTIRNLIVGFGQLFSGMHIVKKDSDGKKDQVVLVPIQYGPRNKWLTMLHQDPDKSHNMNAISPMLAFEITDYRYDANRKIGVHGNHLLGTVGSNRAKIFNPVPYDVYINMYSFAKTQEDSLQILEQILPYFAPSMTLEIEAVAQFNIMKKVPIVLSSVSVNDTYEGDMNSFRTVEQTFTFIAQIDLFGPVIQSDKVIKDVKVNLSTSETSNAGTLIEEVVNPITANKNDTYTITETINEFGFY